MTHDHPKLVIALDYQSAQPCLELVDQLDPKLCRLKVGKELFTSCGPQLVEQLQSKGFDVFLDLKFHDIPNTVAKAVTAAAELGVWMVNVHASGGETMLCAAKEALDKFENRPLLIAVTVLTSMDAAQLHTIGVNSTVDQQVMRLASLTHDCGLDGIVCSALEVSAIKRAFGENFVTVTPGIRPAFASTDDQTRIMTPAQALLAGSDYLVVGRPVTKADNPLQALERIHSEMSEVAE